MSSQQLSPEKIKEMYDRVDVQKMARDLHKSATTTESRAKATLSQMRERLPYGAVEGMKSHNIGLLMTSGTALPLKIMSVEQALERINAAK